MKAPLLKFAVVFLVCRLVTLTHAQEVNEEKAALVIIDMQPYFVKRGGDDQKPENLKKLNDLLKVQVSAIEMAKKQKSPIVFIEYECADCDPTNSILTDAVKGYPHTAKFKKTSDGMFEKWNKYRQDLINYLANQKVNKLILTGANGGACVLDSVQGSAADGRFHVVSLANGIADFNFPEFIYPYSGKYSHIPPTDKDCTFQEVCTVAEAFPAPAKQAQAECRVDPNMARQKKKMSNIVDAIQRQPATQKKAGQVQ